MHEAALTSRAAKSGQAESQFKGVSTMALKDLISAAVSAVANATTNAASSGSSRVSQDIKGGSSEATGGGSIYGGSVYDQQNFTNDELRSAAEIRAAAEAGKTSWDDAHSYVESIRNKYGYSGDSDGSKYIPLEREEERESFSYKSAPSYANKYQGQIDELTQAILNREAFDYDPEKDETYQQYKESYTRNGQRAMQDTLGQVSARTGGLASSYASSASQQTYDNYMGALADKIPELKQLAYSMYQDEGNNQRANLDMLMALEQGDYEKYLNLLGQYNTDRNFDYGSYRDNISDSRYENEWSYQVGRDEIADERYEDETAYDRGTYESEAEYNKALQKAQTLAAAGDFSGYKAMGYTDAEIANLKATYDKAQSAALSSGSRGSSSGGSSGGSGGSAGNSGGTTGIVDTMLGMGSETKAYEYLIGLGLSNAKTEQLWSMYEASSEGGGGESVPSFNDYSEAVAYMKQSGVPSGNASGAMTKSEWARRKASHQQYGQGGTEVTAYGSYSEYLTAYVQYCIETYGG